MRVRCVCAPSLSFPLRLGGYADGAALQTWCHTSILSVISQCPAAFPLSVKLEKKRSIGLTHDGGQ